MGDPLTQEFDIVTVFLAYLKTLTSLVTAVGGANRIYGPPLGRPGDLTTPTKSLVFARDVGGETSSEIPEGNVRLTFQAYGASQEEAGAVALALQNAVHRRRSVRYEYDTGKVVLFHKAMVDSGPFDLPDNLVNWPRVVLVILLYYSETQFIA